MRGAYLESCNCEPICPCRQIGGRPGGRSTHGACLGALGWLIEEGRAGKMKLSGLAAVLAFEYWVDQDAQWLVVAVPLPAGLPRFSLVPRQDPVDDEPVDDEPFGYEFETEDADLGRRYVVYAADGDVAAGVLHLDAVQVLRTHRTVDSRVEGRDLLAVEPAAHREYGPEDIQATIDALARIAAGIPAELFGRYEPVPAYPPPLGPVAPRGTEATPAIPTAPAVPATPPADPLAALRDTTPW